MGTDPTPTINPRGEALFEKSQTAIYRRTDHLFAGLLIFQWLAGIAVALWISPRAWAGTESAISVHLWAAAVLGGLIVIFPVALAMARPGHSSTRHVIAAGQMLIGAILIHLTGGRIETHFQIFGSLAFLAFYRDWRILITGSLVVVIDHLVRGTIYPRSIFGVLSAPMWRVFEHAGWVVFEDIFLIYSCLQGRRELREIADRQAEQEETHQEIEARVCRRTEELAASRCQLEVNNEELRRARDVALEAVKLKSQFLANMSHEIRTPMNGVIGMITILMDTPLSEEQAGYVETVRSSAESLLTVINDILDFSKIEAGKLDLNETDVDLSQLIEETADLLSAQAHSKGLELTHCVGSDIPGLVLADSGRIRQVLTNIVGNAIKFTEKGEVSIEVKPIGQKEDGKVSLEFRVRDTGIGISPEQQSRLFQPFVQADGSTSRKFGGTGLGLAISRRLAELMGGEIRMQSAPGEGSTIFFSIPLMPVSRAVPLPASTRADLVHKRVLVVDDNETNRLVLKQQLSRWGVQTELVESGPAALAKLQAATRDSEPFDLAILDFAMPDMDGIQLATAIRQDPVYQSMPLILLTSYVERKYHEMAMAAGFSAYLTKPVRQLQLYAAMVAVLGGKTSIAVPNEHETAQLSVNGARLLVAEDNVVNQRVASHLLKNMGYECDVVGNGHEALEALARQTYGLVLMDVQMPGMDGLQATVEIRRRNAELGYPVVIAMTAHAMKGDREMCIAAGMNDYVCKPIKRDELREVLARWLAKKKLPNEAPSRLSA